MLDLEGNCVEGLGQLSYLQLCPRLAVLTLEGNPVCLRPGPGPADTVRVGGAGGEVSVAATRQQETPAHPQGTPTASGGSFTSGPAAASVPS